MEAQFKCHQPDKVSSDLSSLFSPLLCQWLYFQVCRSNASQHCKADLFCFRQVLGLPAAVIQQGFPKQTAIVDLVRHSGGSLCPEIEFLVKATALSVALALAGFFLLLSNHFGLSLAV